MSRARPMTPSARRMLYALAGYCDMTPRQRRRYRQKQARLLRKAGIGGPPGKQEGR